MTRVAVTGIGVVSPLGNNAADALAEACAGRSAVHRLDAPFAQRLVDPLVASAQIDGTQHFDPPRLRMLDRVSQFACLAAGQALAESHIDLARADRGRVGVFLGTGMGGSQSSDEGYRSLYEDGSNRVKPFTVLMGMHNAPAAWIGIEHDLRGPNLTYSTACSSSAVAIGEASLRIARGDLDLALAGGAEAPLSLGSLKAWEALHTLATVDVDDPSASCKPFALDRSGMVLGEGSAMILLEAWEHAVARGATILGEIAGYGFANDTGHITRPSIEGQAAAIRAALVAAAIEPSVLTTNQGVAVADNQNSLKAGLRGPTLLEDFILREKITHFDHERIPERIVHARGSAAHGYFECLRSAAEHSRAPRLCRGRQDHAGVRALLHRGRRARLDRHGARRARLSPSSSTPTRATGTWWATTSRCSSSRTR
jgi:3-oxoacyl-(acyl-carrier-protein) synthase